MASATARFLRLLWLAPESTFVSPDLPRDQLQGRVHAVSFIFLVDLQDCHAVVSAHVFVVEVWQVFCRGLKDLDLGARGLQALAAYGLPMTAKNGTVAVNFILFVIGVDGILFTSFADRRFLGSQSAGLRHVALNCPCSLVYELR